MKNEILDENLDEVEETYEVGNEPIYARKSFNQLILSTIIYLSLFFVPLSTRVTHMWHEVIWEKEIIYLFIGFVIGITVLFLNILGMVNASKSERFQEVISWKKYVGAVGNMLMFFPSVILFLEFFSEILSLFIF